MAFDFRAANAGMQFPMQFANMFMQQQMQKDKEKRQLEDFAKKLQIQQDADFRPIPGENVVAEQAPVDFTQPGPVTEPPQVPGSEFDITPEFEEIQSDRLKELNARIKEMGRSRGIPAFLAGERIQRQGQKEIDVAKAKKKMDLAADRAKKLETTEKVDNLVSKIKTGEKVPTELWSDVLSDTDAARVFKGIEKQMNRQDKISAIKSFVSSLPRFQPKTEAERDKLQKEAGLLVKQIFFRISDPKDKKTFLEVLQELGVK